MVRLALFLLTLVVSAVAYGQARICTDRDTIVFGDRQIGSSVSATATVLSCGTRPFRFTDVSIHPATGPGFHIDATCATGATLAPGESCTVTVAFAPTTPGQESGAVWLNNDTSTPSQLITFYGRGTGASAGASVLGFSPGALQVGASVVGVSAAPVRVQLQNRGNAPIVPSALVLNGPAAYDFWTAGDCAVGRPIPVGGGCYLDFTFTPAASGWRLANLVVDAPQLSSLAILLISGTGLDAPAASPPAPPAPPIVDIVEFHHAERDGYFLTADAAEAAFIDEGGVGPGWTRTGRVLRGWPAGSAVAGAVDACRFFGTPDLGPDSHFYTVDPQECAAVKANPYWQYEGVAFRLLPLPNSGCPKGTQVVTRFFKNAPIVTGIRHRYVMSAEDVAAMSAAGWTLEGPVFCSAP